jgi:hypothetical protein
VNGRYAAQQYNPNFVGLFPGDEPQYVIVVKLTNPRDAKGSFYSASTAAPLTRTVLQAALAARDAALDRHKLASSASASLALRPESSFPGDSMPRARVASDSVLRVALADSVRLDSARRAAREVVSAGSVPYVISLEHKRVITHTLEPARAVPDIHGMPLRDAVRSLHSAGFHVRLVRGADGATDPAAGSVVPAGAVVRLFHDF